MALNDAHGVMLNATNTSLVPPGVYNYLVIGAEPNLTGLSLTSGGSTITLTGELTHPIVLGPATTLNRTSGARYITYVEVNRA